MKYTSFIIEKYKGIEKNQDIPTLELKIQKSKAVALIGINECGKSTILKGICCFDYRNDDKDKQYNHLKILKNRNKNTNSSETATIIAKFSLEQPDIGIILDYFNDKGIFAKNSIEEEAEIDGTVQKICQNLDKSDEEKLSIIQKAFKKFGIRRQLSKNNNLLESKYTLEFEQDIKESIMTNVNITVLDDTQNDLCKKLISLMPHMLYITDLPDFFSENKFSVTGSNKEEECKNLINNLFISGTSKSLNVDKFFELYSLDKSEYFTTKSQVESFLNREFSQRWNQFGLNETFGDLQISIIPSVESKTINIQVKEKSDSGENYYPIDERSMGFQWFFKFIMNISFNPLKEKGILFLIDEPGTYLHESAQTILSRELNTILHDNYMIFSTHYYSMLNLKEIELNKIYVVERTQKSIIATKATDYKGYSDESKKSPVLPILNAFRKTIIDFIKSEQAKKILIVEGLYDKYAISVFCNSPKWSEIEIFPSVGASQIADNMSEFAYYRKDILALFDNDYAGIEAFKNIKPTNALYLDVKEGYQNDPTKSLVMNDLFESDELTTLANRLRNDGIETFDSYKEILKVLYEDRALVDKYKQCLTKTLDNFKTLETSILEKFRLIKPTKQ